MYCKNCGNPINAEQAICLKCGAAKSGGSKYCAHCGNILNEGADICLKCGYSVKLSAEKTENDTEIHCTNCGKSMKSMQEVCLSCGAKNGSGKKYCRHCGSELNENAAICLGCGREIKNTSSISMPNFSAVGDKIKNIDTSAVNEKLKNLNTDAITENKFGKYIGIAISALMLICMFLFPYFKYENIISDMSISGFTALFGGFALFNFFMLFPLILPVFQILCQFIQKLDKFKNISNLICGAGSLISLIIAVIIETNHTIPMFNVHPEVAFGFVINIILAVVMTAYGFIIFIKKK